MVVIRFPMLVGGVALSLSTPIPSPYPIHHLAALPSGPQILLLVVDTNTYLSNESFVSIISSPPCLQSFDSFGMRHDLIASQ